MSDGAHRLTVKAEIHSSDKDDSADTTTTTEMCSACGRPVKNHIEAGNGFGVECIWKPREPTKAAANSQELPADPKDATSPPKAAPVKSSPPKTVSEDEIARLQAERDKLLRQYEAARLQQEIAGLRAALGTSVTDLATPSQALGASVGDPTTVPVPKNVAPPPPTKLQNIKHQPQIKTALKRLSSSVDFLNDILSHSTDGDDYFGDQETLDTEQWSPSSSFVKKDEDPNLVASRTGYLRQRMALQSDRLQHLSRKHSENRVGIDHVRDWLENSHAAHNGEGTRTGSTDSGVRSPAVSPTSVFGGSMPDVNDGQGQKSRRIPARSQSFQIGQLRQTPRVSIVTPHEQGLTRSEALMRRRTLQNERVQYWNSKLITNERERVQRSAVQNWLENKHTGQTAADRRRHHSDTRGYQRGPNIGRPGVEVFNPSYVGGSMPDLHNYKVKHQHGELWSHGKTESTRKLSELGAIGEGVEEAVTEDANDYHAKAENGQVTKHPGKFPSTSSKEDRRFQKHNNTSKQVNKNSEALKTADAVVKTMAGSSMKNEQSARKTPTTDTSQSLATSEEAPRRRSRHNSRKQETVRPRDREAKNPRGAEVKSTADIVSHFFEDERIPKADTRLKREPKGASGGEVGLPSRNHPEKQDARSKKAPQENLNPREPRKFSRSTSRRPHSPSRSPRRHHSPARSPQRHHSSSRNTRKPRSPSRHPKKPADNRSRRDTPDPRRRATKNEPGRSRSMDVEKNRPTRRGQRPSARDPSNLRSRRSTETSSDGKTGIVRKEEEQPVERKRNPSGRPTMDQASDAQKGNTSKGWTSMMSLGQTVDHTMDSGLTRTKLPDDQRATWKTYRTGEDVSKTPYIDTKPGFFDGFRGSFLNLVGGDEQKEKNPVAPNVLMVSWAV
ncbi:uncharacterized protein LOC144925475 [Branchiostoma floridae x Branchiostoma belcheri]